MGSPLLQTKHKYLHKYLRNLLEFHCFTNQSWNNSDSLSVFPTETLPEIFFWDLGKTLLRVRCNQPQTVLLEKSREVFRREVFQREGFQKRRKTTDWRQNLTNHYTPFHKVYTSLNPFTTFNTFTNNSQTIHKQFTNNSQIPSQFHQPIVKQFWLVECFPPWVF